MESYSQKRPLWLLWELCAANLASKPPTTVALLANDLAKIIDCDATFF